VLPAAAAAAAASLTATSFLVLPLVAFVVGVRRAEVDTAVGPRGIGRGRG
jgi:hypothetical protein